MRARKDPRENLPGVRLRGRRWYVYFDPPNGKQITRKVDHDDPTAEQLLAAHRRLSGTIVPVKAGSMAQDVAAYLRQRAAAPSIANLAYNLDRWLDELGRDRASASVLREDINEVIQRWLKGEFAPIVLAPGKRDRRKKMLDPETIRVRVGTLQGFFTALFLNDPHHKNPCVGCNRPIAKPPSPRGVIMPTVAEIIEAMPMWRSTRRGEPKQLSHARIYASVVAYTGLDPAQIKRLRRNDIDLVGRTLRTYRRKGEGVAEMIVPLTEAGVAAMRAFIEAGLVGRHYYSSVVNDAIKCAAVHVGIPRGSFRQKDFRHSFLTHMFRVTKDTTQVARFAVHAPGSPMTQRYTLTAHEEVDRASADRFAVPMPAFTPQAPATVIKIAARRRR